MTGRDEKRHDKTTGPSQRLGVAIVLGFFVANGLLEALYRYFEGLTIGADQLLADALVAQLTSAAAVAIGFFVVIVPACRRFPLRRPLRPRRLLAHVGGFVAYSVLKTLLMWGTRTVLYPIAGLGSYEYGRLAFRFPMEAAGDAVGYVVFAAAVHAWDAWMRAREREVEAARLEAKLSEARLAVLRSQLQPHFLFNTLNTIASLVHDDPEVADRMITRLSDLLRRSLDSRPRSEVAVHEEVESLEDYLEIMRTRFGPRLEVELKVDPKVREAQVPPLLVQPLLENAIKHGVAKRMEGGRIDVRFECAHGRLCISVRDDGPGLGTPGGGAEGGIGIANTRDRLHLLYGGDACLRLSDRSDRRGVVCLVEMPLRYASTSSGGSSQ